MPAFDIETKRDTPSGLGAELTPVSSRESSQTMFSEDVGVEVKRVESRDIAYVGDIPRVVISSPS
jgi:hypothetical protein